jgi:RNA polymerase sigma factor (sigma-70 family)
MATGQWHRTIDALRRVVGGRADGKEPDARLLAAFAQRGDEAAFEAILQRHGPMVLGVCRRVLGPSADADDAFQATFLVLVKKSNAIAKRSSLASWLHGVAYRTAVRARSLAARRREHERRAVPMTETDNHRASAIRELRPVLDEELARLPDKYRELLVLCYLQGKTKGEVAKALGWPHGTVSGRLARARDLLRSRLARRGLVLPATLLAMTLPQAAACAAVPAPLLVSTLKAASVCAAGSIAVGGAISAPVAALTQGVLDTMMLTKLKLAVALVAAVGLLLTGAGAIAYHGWAGEPGSATAQVAQTKAEKRAARREAKEAESILGQWHVIEAERGGKKPEGTEADLTKAIQFTFTKEALTLSVAGTEAKKFKYTLDPAKKPATIALTDDEKKESITGIYELKGDTLKLCVSNRGPEDPVPTEFKSKAGDQYMLFTLQRGPAAKATPEDQAKVKEAANRAISQNNLKQIALAFHNYHDTNQHFPAGAIYSKEGKPLLSWRVAILPFLDQAALYKAFKLDEPWDSEHNKKLLAQMPKVYELPGKKTADKHVTFYRVFAGKDTLFDGEEGKSLAKIRDGTSNTILALEAADPVVWTKPEELAYADNAALPKLGGYFTGGFNVAMCDGSVRFVSQSVDEKALRLFITPNDGQVVDHDALDPKKK